ncbi:MAG: hypothetical protein ACRDVM_10295, partial [Acidimicrobiia bacterium]
MQAGEKLAAIAVLVIAAWAGVWFAGRPPPAVPLEAGADRNPEPSAPATLTVYVSGAVAQPGLV